MRLTSTGIRVALACLIAFASAAVAHAEDELIPGQLHEVRPGQLAQLVTWPTRGRFDLPAGDPSVTGGSLQIVDTGGASPSMTVALPAANWRGLGKPAGSLGWEYRGAGTASDPCSYGLVSPFLLGFVCKGAGVTLAPPFAGTLAIVFTVNGSRYSAEFGGKTLRNDRKVLKRIHAKPPFACHEDGGGSTTSTSSTSSTSLQVTTTSTSSTSSTTAPTPTTS